VQGSQRLGRLRGRAQPLARPELVGDAACDVGLAQHHRSGLLAVGEL
jgi:hypothetical protein